MKESPPQKEVRLRSRNSLPLHRSIQAVVILADYLKEQGIDIEILLSGSGITARDLDNTKTLISPQQELQLMKKAVELAQDQRLGLKLGVRYNIGVSSMVSIPAMFCDTLLDAIRLVFQYVDLTLTYFRWELRVCGELAFMKAEELIDLGDLRYFISESEFIAYILSSRTILGIPWTLNELRLNYPRPGHASYYRKLTQCPVLFDAGENVAVFDSSLLYQPLPLANAPIRRMYEKECKLSLLRLREQGTTIDIIRHALFFHDGNLPSLEQLARRLNVSPRTLRRRLADEGTSFKELINDFRKHKAVELLKSTDTPIEQIAIDLGYSDVPNFYHAFRRWTGTTPSNYRKTERQAHAKT